jgi:VanZ family protein
MDIPLTRCRVNDMQRWLSLPEPIEPVFAFLTRPQFRGLYALAWTVLLCVTLVQSSSQPVIGPAAPPAPPDLGRELFLTAGHIIGFSVLTVLWQWTLMTRWSPTRAVMLAVMIALMIGTLTELAQIAVPDRNASLFDLSVNWLIAVAVGLWLYKRRQS